MTATNKSVQSPTRSLLHEVLDKFFLRKITAANQMSATHERQWIELQRLVNAGGKRLRPDMVFLAYQTFGGTDTAAIAPIAAAQELLHQSLLIHDDIIDRDYVRHGVANIQGSYRDYYAEYVHDVSDRDHFAGSAALLAGNLLLVGGYELIAHSQIEPEIKQEVTMLFSQGIFAVSGGELMDVESTFLPHGQTDTIGIATYKTAYYSFAAPLLIGATLAGASHAQKQLLGDFAKNLGIAFQLKDDLLGVFGDDALTGKTTTGDITEGKYTYLVESFYQLAGDADRAAFDQSFGKHDASSAEIDDVKGLLESSGAKQATQDKIAAYEQLCEHALEMLDIDDAHRAQLGQLIDKALRRVR